MNEPKKLKIKIPTHVSLMQKLSDCDNEIQIHHNGYTEDPIYSKSSLDWFVKNADSYFKTRAETVCLSVEIEPIQYRFVTYKKVGDSAGFVRGFGDSQWMTFYELVDDGTRSEFKLNIELLKY